MDPKLTLLSYVCFVASAAAVYFFAKRGVATLPPLLLNGYRLTLAGVFLLLVSVFINAPLAVDLKTVSIYAVVALLAIAIPQALLFVALKRTDVSETMAAFIEGCIPGIVFVFLLASDPYANSVLTSFSVFFSLVGLAIFLGVRPRKGAGGLGTGERMVLRSAVLTAAGLLIAASLLPSAGSSAAEKLRQSIANTAWTAFLAGVSTLLHYRLRKGAKFIVPDRKTIGYVIGLALIGTCLGWGSFFVLLREDVLTAATSDIAVPVAVAGLNWMFFAKKMDRTQILGAAIITLSLTLLIFTKL